MKPKLLIALSTVCFAGWAVLLSGCSPSTAPSDESEATAGDAPAADQSTDEVKEMAAAEEPAPKPAPKPEAKPDPAQKKVTEPSPAPKPVSAPPLVMNSSFEVKKDGVPEFWSVADKSILVESTDAADGGHPLALTGPEDGWGIVVQQINAPKTAFGKTLVVSAMGKASVPGQLFMDVLYAVDGKKETVRQPFPAEKEWKELVIEAPIPKNADPNSLRVRILIRGGAQGKYLVDKLNVSVKR